MEVRPRPSDGAWLDGSFEVNDRGGPIGPVGTNATGPFLLALVPLYPGFVPKGIAGDGVILTRKAMFQKPTPNQQVMFDEAKAKIRQMLIDQGLDPNDFSIL